jgi:hypothetical protein
MPPLNPYIDIVFNRPPSEGPAEFMGVEDEQGESIDLQEEHWTFFGSWTLRPDGIWVLRISLKDHESDD